MLVSLAVYCVCLERICGFAGYMADYGRPYSINMFTFLQMFAVVHNVCKTLIFGGNFA